MNLLKLQLLAALIIGAIACQNPEQESNADLAVPHGDDVGDASLTDKDLEKIANAKGKTVETVDFAELKEFLDDTGEELILCNFWATWCKPCVEEMPHFEQLQREFEDQNLSVVFVSMDKPSELDKVTTFVRKNQITAEVVLMEEDELTKEEWMKKLSENWKGNIPVTFFIKTKSEINEFYPNTFKSYGELKAKVLPYL